ncbi:MAG: nuclear transport factor 2 family protein [Saprospirales bacterium]|nr:nuclear transport factor 2 family protein [Saprospirales bacterium]
MDSLLSVAYNAYDLDQLGRLFDEDLEFYHDTGGLLTYRQSLDGLKSVFEKNNQARRFAEKRYAEVYPIKDYGAVQTGLHVFCHLENGKEQCATFKFVHIWRKKTAFGESPG